MGTEQGQPRGQEYEGRSGRYETERGPTRATRRLAAAAVNTAAR